VTRRVLSSIDRLRADVKARIDAWLRVKQLTQLDILAVVNAELAGRGAPTISRSGLSRYAQRLGKAGEKIRETNAVARAWVGELGAEPESRTGELLVQTIRTLAFDLGATLAEADTPASAPVITALARSVRDLEIAAKVSAEREIAIRKETAKRAAEVVKGAGRKAGLSAEAIATIQRDILGLAAA